MKISKSLLLGIIISFATHPAFATKPAASLTASELNTLSIVAAIDSAEILVSVIATNKKPTDDVEKLADMMIDQHGGNLTQILTLLKQANVDNLNSESATKIALQNKRDIITLGGMEGNQFNTAYVNAMIAGHEGALKLIDSKLMKTATSEEMKNFMTETRAAVVHHLEMAKKTQEEMSGID